jgi:hypothetical protein
MNEKSRSLGKLTKAELDKRDADGKIVRPEMIERGRKLLANPDWPNMDQARDLAQAILPTLY